MGEGVVLGPSCMADICLLNGDSFCFSALITLLHLQTVAETAGESEKESGRVYHTSDGARFGTGMV